MPTPVHSGRAFAGFDADTQHSRAASVAHDPHAAKRDGCSYDTEATFRQFADFEMRKKALVDFTRVPDYGTVFPNVVRGTLSLGLAVFIGYLMYHSAAQAYQLDVDGKVGIGQVVLVNRRTSRRSIRYELDVSTSNGILTLNSNSPVDAGEYVRYIYSPSSRIAQLAPRPLQRGDMLWATFKSSTNIWVTFAFVCCAYYAYNQYWWVHVVASGRYTVHGRSVHNDDSFGRN